MSSSLLMRGPARRALALSLAAAAVTGVAAAACTPTQQRQPPCHRPDDAGPTRLVVAVGLSRRAVDAGKRLERARQERLQRCLRDSAGAAGQQDGLGGTELGEQRGHADRWGLGYIGARYGGPCAAWSHSQATGWY